MTWESSMKRGRERERERTCQCVILKSVYPCFEHCADSQYETFPRTTPSFSSVPPSPTRLSQPPHQLAGKCCHHTCRRRREHQYPQPLSCIVLEKNTISWGNYRKRGSHARGVLLYRNHVRQHTPCM